MNGIHIANTGWLHTASIRVYCVYRTYHYVDQAFKKMIMDAFKDKYLNALSDEIVGYVNCKSLQLISNLLKYCAMIAHSELTQNHERLKTPYDPNKRIKNIFQQIRDAREFALAGGQPHRDVMIVNVACTLVFNTDLFPVACHI
jgi:hypothetical protein